MCPFCWHLKQVLVSVPPVKKITLCLCSWLNPFPSDIALWLVLKHQYWCIMCSNPSRLSTPPLSSCTLDSAPIICLDASTGARVNVCYQVCISNCPCTVLVFVFDGQETLKEFRRIIFNLHNHLQELHPWLHSTDLITWYVLGEQHLYHFLSQSCRPVICPCTIDHIH